MAIQVFGLVQQEGDAAGNRAHALGTLALRTQFVVVNHLVQPRHAGLQRLLAVLVEEKLGIGQARTHHALVAANHRAGINRADVADDEKFVGQLACRIEQRKVLLVGLHGENQAFLWHVQKLGFKLTDQHVGALHQAGDFVEQGVVFNRACAMADLVRSSRQLAHDLGATLGKAGNHRAVLGQRGGVIVGMRQHHRRDPGFKTVAQGAVARREPQYPDRHHGAAVQRHQAVRRAHKVHAAPAWQLAIRFQLVTHDLGDGQLGNCLFQRLLQAGVECGAGDQAVIKQRFGLAVRGFSEGGHGGWRVGHIRAQRLQFFDKRGRGLTVSVQPHRHRHQFLLHRLVSGFQTHLGDVRGQAAR